MSAILAAFINGGIAGAAITIAVCLVLSIAPRRALNAATRYAIWWTTLMVVVTMPVFYLPHRADPVSARPIHCPVANANHRHRRGNGRACKLRCTEPQPSPWPRFPFEFNAGAWPARIFTALGDRRPVHDAAPGLQLRRAGAAKTSRLRRRKTPSLARASLDLRRHRFAHGRGLFRPAILLPERLLTELDDDELEQIRVHETAHLDRRDDIDCSSNAASKPSSPCTPSSAGSPGASTWNAKSPATILWSSRPASPSLRLLPHARRRNRRWRSIVNRRGRRNRRAFPSRQENRNAAR